MLKNYLKFLEVKQSWDPNLDRSEFLEGNQFCHFQRGVYEHILH